MFWGMSQRTLPLPQVALAHIPAAGRSGESSWVRQTKSSPLSSHASGTSAQGSPISSGSQSESVRDVQPGAQQPSSSTQAVTISSTQATSQVSGEPVNVRPMHPSVLGHEFGQSPSQDSESSMTPLPQPVQS